jgi:hypothetical protein
VGEHINEFTAAPVSTCWHTPGPKMSVPPSPSTKAQLLFTKYVTQCALLPSTPPIWERPPSQCTDAALGSARVRLTIRECLPVNWWQLPSHWTVSPTEPSQTVPLNATIVSAFAENVKVAAKRRAVKKALRYIVSCTAVG